MLIFSHFIKAQQQPSPNDAVSLFESASRFKSQGQFDSAAIYFIRHYNQIHPDSINDKAKTAFHTGRSFGRSGQPERAIEYFEKSASHFEDLGNYDNFWIAMGNMANMYDDLGQFQQAIQLTKESLHYFREQKDTAEMGKVMNNLALYYYKNRQIDEAIQTYLENIEMLQDKDPISKAIAYNQLGNIWAEELKDENRALEYYLKSLEMRIPLNNPASLSAAYNNIGISYKNLDMADSAIVNYQRALHYGEISGQPRRVLSPLINLGNIHQRQGDTDKALEYFQMAEEMSDRITFRQKLNIWLSMGKLYIIRGEYQNAIIYLTKGYELAEKESDYSSLLEFMPVLGRALGGSGNFRRAYEIQQQFIILNDSLNIQSKEELIADLLIEYETAEKELALLNSQNLLQEKELQLKGRTLTMISVIGLVVIISLITLTLYRQKKSAEKQALLKLNLAEEKARTKIQEDRLNISRELHDNIGSQLTFVNAGLEQFLYTDNPPSPGQIRLLKENLTQSMRELRKTVWLISKTSASIEEISLRLRDAFKPVQQNGIRVELTAEGDTEQKLNEIQTTHLFRVLQEAVNNAVKHSGCKRIDIRIAVLKLGEVTVEVSDDGSGFDPEAVEKSNGLVNMKYRLDQLGGVFGLDTQPGKGTTITLSFPLKLIR